MIAFLLAAAVTSASPAATPTCVAPDGTRFQLEIAADDRSKQLGLMFRDHLPHDRGMLFLFDADAIYPFWLKNTYISLDIIWLDAAGKVVELRPRAAPCPRGDCPEYTPANRARAVLEVNGGHAEQHGIEVGVTLTFENVQGYPIAKAGK